MRINLPSKWECFQLNDLVDIKISNGAFNDPQKVGKGYRLINVQDLYQEPEVQVYNLSLLDLTEDEFLRYKAEKGDLFFTRSSLKLEGIAHCNIYNSKEDNVVFECHIMRVRVNRQKILPLYLYYYSKTFLARKYFMRRAKMTTMTTIDQKDLGELPVLTPLVNEQQRIIDIIYSLDSSIDIMRKLILSKREFKKALIQQLLTGKKRLKRYKKNPFEIRKLKGLLKEVSVRNRNLECDRVLSVTNSNGFVVQTEHFDKVVASQDVSNYKIVKKGQFGYNPSRVNVGSIARLENYDNGILSPMYVIFETKADELLPEYMSQFITSYNFLGKVCCLTQGSVRDSLDFGSLEQIRLFVPSIEEQREIADFLSTVDSEINLLEDLKNSNEIQKKGLMQRLLTGDVRVKV